MIGMPGQTELIIIACIALLLFGKRLPSVMRSLGSSIFEFKNGLTMSMDAIADETDKEDAQA